MPAMHRGSQAAPTQTQDRNKPRVQTNSSVRVSAWGSSEIVWAGLLTRCYFHKTFNCHKTESRSIKFDLRSMSKQAMIFGATGAVGRKLLDLCLNGDRYEKVTVIARGAASISHVKLNWLQVDFDGLTDLDPFPGLVGGDAFCCLGTTIKAAGSKEGFRRVDFDYILNAAKFSKRCSVRSFSMVSAVGANVESSNFYSRTKGEVELAVMAEKIDVLRILRPSLLKGARDEFRIKEKVGNIIAVLLMPVFFFGLRKYQPIDIEKLARVLYESVNEDFPSGSVCIYKNIELLAC